MSKSSPLNGSCSESPRRAARIERALRNRETTAPDPVRDKVLYNLVFFAVLLIGGLQMTLFAMWFDMEANKDLR